MSFQFIGCDIVLGFVSVVCLYFLQFADVLTWIYLRMVFLSAARRLMSTPTVLACRNPCHWTQYILVHFGKSIVEFSILSTYAQFDSRDNMQLGSRPRRRSVMVVDT